MVELGFTLTSNLCPSPQMAIISSKMFKVLRFIMQLSIDFKLAKLLKPLNCALVRRILEYGSVSLNCF